MAWNGQGAKFGRSQSDIKKIARGRMNCFGLASSCRIPDDCICESVSRSGLDRCLRRHGVGNLHALKPREPQAQPKAFRRYEPGYVHVDVKYLPQMLDQNRRPNNSPSGCS